MRFPVFCETSSPAARRAVVLFCLLLAASAPAATYHVSNSASSDSYPGTEAQPFATLTKALSASGWGDTVLLARGSTFRIGGLNLGSSRTFAAYGTTTLPNPVIAGSDVITGWAPSAAGSPILVAAVPAGVTGIKQVYVDGRRMTLARFPNTGWLRTAAGSNHFQIVDPELPKLPIVNWTGAQVHWRKWTWVYDTRTIASDSGSGTLALAGDTAFWDDSAIGSGYFIDNALKALDVPGEWFYDATAAKLYLYPPVGAAAAAMQVEAAFRETAGTVRGATLEGLTIQHFTTTGLIIADSPGTLRNCVVQHNGAKGIYATWNCNGTLITGCVIRDNLDIGIAWNEDPARSGGSIVEHCTLERNGSVPGLAGSGSWHGVGMVVGNARGLQFRFNRVTETGYAGIILGTDGHTVTRNVFRRCMATYNDGAAIYTHSSSNHITENIILDTIGDLESAQPWYPMGRGIWLEYLKKFHDSIITDNTIYGSGSDGIWLPNNYHCTVSRNVLVSNRRAALSLGGWEKENPGTPPTPLDPQQNHTLADNTLAIGARPWRPFPGQVQTLDQWAVLNDYLLGFVTSADFDLDFGTMSGTKLLTRDGADLVLRDGNTSRTLAQWKAEESAWADPAPTTYQGNGYLFINDTEATVAFPLPAGVTWLQLGGAAVGSTVSIAPFRSVVLLAASGNVAGLSPYYLASGEAGPLSFPEWVVSYGLPAPVGQTAADSDGDGLPDLVEYAAGLSPVARDAVPPLQTAPGAAGGLELTYRRRTGLSGVTQQLETSTDLNTWTPVDTSSAATTAIAGEPFVRAMKLSLPATAESRAFYRLKLSAP